MSFTTGVGARLGLRATFVCKNAAGEVIKTIEAQGAIPLADLGMTEDEARALIEKESQHGSDSGK